MLEDDKTEKASNTLQLICPTCGARYTLPKYVEGQRTAASGAAPP